MSIFTKRGSAAVDSATAEKDTQSSALVSFTSGTSLKVRVKSAEDSVEYYAYGMFGKVNTFVPEKSAERNDRGYVTANPTVWDRAADALYADSKAAKDAGNETLAKEISDEAYNFRGKARYLVAFGSLETGEDIIVDLTQNQAKAVFAAIAKYAKRLDKLAFELAKTGSSTSTVVSLSPIIDMDEDLTEAERKNFAKAGEKPFDFGKFEEALFVADEAEQIKNLVKADFDIGRLGLTYGGGVAEEVTPISDEDAPPEVNF